ncbi:MAG: TIGR02594 family protein [Tardiphaga sp.]|nr:TIGR02594 family protein [Tardiphaga sp.]
MVQFNAYRRAFRYFFLALFSVVVVSVATPASARPQQNGHHARSHHKHEGHSARHHGRHHSRHRVRASRRQATLRSADSAAEAFSNNSGFGSSNLVAEARRYIGGNPTGRGRLWCARFMNMVLQRSGHQGTGSDMARSFSSYGQRISGPQVGAIAVMSRGRRGGHVGVVSGIDPSGNPIIVSGNHGNRVAGAT